MTEDIPGWEPIPELMPYEVCPMTIVNCEKYRVSDDMQKRFCNLGCCSECDILFIEKFGKRRKA